MGIQSTPYIGVSRARCRIQCRHAAIADGGDHHREHRDQDDGRKVPIRELLRDAVERHRRDWLNENDAVKDEIP